MEAILKQIAENTAPENIHKVIELDTSLTSLQQVNVLQALGISIGNSITVLNEGGGLYIGVSLDDPLEVGTNDSFEDERFEVFTWKGSGSAGTAILRIGGKV